MATGKRSTLILLAFLFILLLVLGYLGYRYYFPGIDKAEVQKIEPGFQTLDYQPLYMKSGALYYMGFSLRQNTHTYRTVEVSGILEEIRKEDDNLYGVIRVPKDGQTYNYSLSDAVTVFFGGPESRISVYKAIDNKEAETRNWEIMRVDDIGEDLTEGSQVIAEVFSYIDTGSYCADERLTLICDNYEKYAIGNAGLDRLVYLGDAGVVVDNSVAGPVVSLVYGVK
jgi:hypothetical protein